MSEKPRVYIANLSFSIPWQEIRDLCRLALKSDSNQGEIVGRVDLAKDEEGKSLGIATIEVLTMEDAKMLIEKLNGSSYRGRTLQASIHNSKKPLNPPSGKEIPIDTNVLYVSNLPYEVTWQQIKDHFGQHGRIFKVDIPPNQQGVANVHMVTVSDARRATNALHGKPFLGRPLKISQHKYLNTLRSPPTQVPTDGTLVIVRNLPFSFRDAQLKELLTSFDVHPTHSSILMTTNPTRPSTGIAHLYFESEPLALQAIQIMDQTTVQERQLTLTLSSKHEHE